MLGSEQGELEMSYDYCTECGTAYDWDVSPEGCPTCPAWKPTVEMITYDHQTSGQAPWMQSHFGVAQWIPAGDATAFSHWHVWAYKSDMLEAMQETLDCAEQGGRWAVVTPTEFV